MSQKLTLARYLEGRGSVKSLTRIEAEAFGVPYPLISGWPARHGAIEITAAMIEDLTARVASAGRSTASKARRGLDGVGMQVASEASVGDPRRPCRLAVLDSEGNPIEILATERATALDVLTFFRSLLNRISLEDLAQREGKTFDHLFGSAIGARAIGCVSANPTGQG